VVLGEAIDEHHTGGGGDCVEGNGNPSSNYFGQILIRGNNIV